MNLFGSALQNVFFLFNSYFAPGGNATVNSNNNGSSVETSGRGMQADVPPLIPRHILYGNPDKANPAISPDGKWFAYLAPVDGVLNIWVQPLSETLQGKTEGRPITYDKGRGILGFSWTMIDGVILYSQDQDGNENFRLYKLNVATTKVELLTDTDGVLAEIVASDYKYPDLIIIGLNNRNPQFHDMYRLNLTTGEKKLLYQNNEFSGFIFDNDLQIRLATKDGPEGETLLLKPTKDAAGNINNWELYRKISLDDSTSTSLLQFDNTNKKAYWLDSTDRDLGALYLQEDFDDPNSTKTLIYEPKKSDVGSVLFHPTLSIPLVASENYKLPEITILNKTYQEDFDYLNNLEPGSYPSLASSSLDFKKWIVMLSKDDGPPRIYYYDRNTRKAVFLFTSRKELAKYRQSRMFPVEIKTRDGLVQVCYLTLPLESDPLQIGHPLTPQPMVLEVHGGPWARDYWGYDRQTQGLANRGYAVLQCNYRSSTGYGKAFMKAGNGEWAAKMHDDLLDAVQWAIDQKIADPNRIAIAGGSYGGYATLVGLSFTPDVFACGIDIVGPTNLVTLMQSIPPYWKPEWKKFVVRIGASPETPAGVEYLKSRSPLFKVNQIRKPLLIGQGLNDPRVKVNESEQIVNGLKEHKIPVTYVLFPNEGHGFVRPENTVAFAAISEEFLANCLGGRYEPAGSDVNKSSAQILERGNFTRPLQPPINGK